MSKTEEKKQIYEVWIIRHDGEHIKSFSDTNYDKCYENWKELTVKWKECVSTKVPMELERPLITCFDPGLVKEITLRPVIEVEQSKYNNPYHQQMMRDGLGNTLKNTGNMINPDLLDQGYS